MEEIKTNEQPITNINLKLAGEDGNAFFILARAMGALEEGGMMHLWREFYKEATSGDYDHLLSTCAKYFKVA